MAYIEQKPPFVEVIEPGQQVIVAGKFGGYLLGVRLTAGSVSYEVGYWTANAWVQVVLPAVLVTLPDDGVKMNVGFQQAHD